jgi:hypothetical protein
MLSKSGDRRLGETTGHGFYLGNLLQQRLLLRLEGRRLSRPQCTNPPNARAYAVSGL